MATIYKEIEIAAEPARVWDALADFDHLHERLVPGFVTDSRSDGHTRVITFFDGVVVSERLVGADPDVRRLAYTVVESPFGAEHHHASAQVVPAGPGRSRFVWVTDVLPDELAAPIDGLMEQGLAAIKQTLEG